jgi:hypothetical protein
MYMSMHVRTLDLAVGFDMCLCVRVCVYVNSMHVRTLDLAVGFDMCLFVCACE